MIIWGVEMKSQTDRDALDVVFQLCRDRYNWGGLGHSTNVVDERTSRMVGGRHTLDEGDSDPLMMVLHGLLLD